MVRCNNCMKLFNDDNILVCPYCETDEYLMDILPADIVYTADDGMGYTKLDVEFEIGEWMQGTSYESMRQLNDDQAKKAIDIIFNMVMSIISWEHPCTVLDQFDDEDVQEILDKLSE